MKIVEGNDIDKSKTSSDGSKIIHIELESNPSIENRVELKGDLGNIFGLDHQLIRKCFLDFLISP